MMFQVGNPNEIKQTKAKVNKQLCSEQQNIHDAWSNSAWW